MGSTVSTDRAREVTMWKQWSSPSHYTQPTVSAMERKQRDPGTDTGKRRFSTVSAADYVLLCRSQLSKDKKDGRGKFCKKTIQAYYEVRAMLMLGLEGLARARVFILHELDCHHT